MNVSEKIVNYFNNGFYDIRNYNKNSHCDNAVAVIKIIFYYIVIAPSLFLVNGCCVNSKTSKNKISEIKEFSIIDDAKENLIINKKVDKQFVDKLLKQVDSKKDSACFKNFNMTDVSFKTEEIDLQINQGLTLLFRCKLEGCEEQFILQSQGKVNTYDLGKASIEDLSSSPLASMELVLVAFKDCNKWKIEGRSNDKGVFNLSGRTGNEIVIVAFSRVFSDLTFRVK